jgi:hypothetical protein
VLAAHTGWQPDNIGRLSFSDFVAFIRMIPKHG